MTQRTARDSSDPVPFPFPHQSLARLGATTTAIDASEINIKTATLHASFDDHLTHRSHLEYRHCAAEHLVQEGKQFDVVCAMEVIEHVSDPKAFLRCLAQLTKVKEPEPEPEKRIEIRKANANADVPTSSGSLGFRDSPAVIFSFPPSPGPLWLTSSPSP